MKVAKFSFFVSIIIILSLTGVINAQWFEKQYPSAGNISLFSSFTGSSSGDQGFSIPIPDSHYILYSSGRGDSYYFYAGNKMILFDTSTARFRDIFSREALINDPVIIPDPRGGWNIFFHEYSIFKQIHIDAHGEFGEETDLPKTYNGVNIKGIGIIKTGDVWFVADKIYRYNTRSFQWTEYPYPAGWDTDFKDLKLYLTEDQSKLFITSKSNTIADYQGMIFDLNNETGSLIQSPEVNFFLEIYNITEWLNHDGMYLVQKRSALWTYNIKTNNMEHFIDTNDAYILSPLFSNILQSASGKYIYYLGTITENPWSIGSDFYILDLENKTMELHSIELDDGWSFYFGIKIIDRENNRIITSIQDVQSNEQKPIIINLADLSWSYIPADYMNISTQLLYIPEENKIIVSGGQTNPFQTIDLTTGGSKKSISVSYTPDNWSFKKDSMGPDLLGNFSGPSFCRLKAPGIREMHDLGLMRNGRIVSISQFPDGESAVMRIYSDSTYFYEEYSFKDDSMQNIDLPMGLVGNNTYSDPVQNQLIYLKDSVIQFMKPHGSIRVFKLPEDNNLSTFKFSLYDQDNNFIWIAGINSSNELVFFKISPEKYDIVNYYKSNDTVMASGLSSIVNSTIDPLERYFYLIQRTNYNDSYHKTELMIYDIPTAKLLKRQLLQDNAFEYLNERVVPALIPIPQRDKLFLWDGYRGWCFDTSSIFMNLIYGKMVDNPKVDVDLFTQVTGVWDAKRELAIIVDQSYIYDDINRNTKRVLEINIDLGAIVNSITIPKDVLYQYINQDKDRIFFLVPDKSQVLTLHLTPQWNDPATIDPKTNYIQYGIGDGARFTLKIRNPYDYQQKVVAYIWLVTPKGDILFMTYDGIYSNPVGVLVTLPANLDFSWDIFNFSVPQIMPEGFYNFNAVFINENGDRGPIGSWNFYVKN
jgi:hypothetical protein